MDVDTRAVPARQRLEYWHENVRDRFVPLLVAPSDPQVQGRIRHREIAGTKVRRIAGTEHVFRRREDDIRLGGDPDELNLLFVNRGTTVVEQDDRTAVLTPGDFLLYDSARPFEFRTRGSFDYTIVLMPKGPLGLSRGGDTACTVRPGSARDGLAASVRRLVESLVVAEEPDGELRTDLRLQESLLGAVSCLVPAARSGEPPRVPVALVRALVRRHFRDPRLSPATIAAACGISVSYLHRAFAGEETTVAGLIREERLQAALRLLVSPGSRRESIAAIGRRCGLPDAAHFSRAFHRRFGLSPRDVRDRFARA
ncbi:helix-turn-helix domain-containing protein [Nakamurella flava]|uniref:helix-turn-helix domain-containing protein n=1 Tax=Nakamurella flava TaxID=2576308 RepID=UPI00140D39F3|nr:helix-turn-helix domain-containing protein [Nakamurella flava]